MDRDNGIVTSPINLEITARGNTCFTVARFHYRLLFNFVFLSDYINGRKNHRFDRHATNRFASNYNLDLLLLPKDETKVHNGRKISKNKNLGTTIGKDVDVTNPSTTVTVSCGN